MTYIIISLLTLYLTIMHDKRHNLTEPDLLDAAWCLLISIVLFILSKIVLFLMKKVA